MINCRICGKECKDKRGLSRHLQILHHLEELKSYYDQYLGDSRYCPTCGKETRFNGLTKGYSKYCKDMKCISKDESIKRKKTETCLEKFGTTTNLKCEDSKQKIQKTCLKRYGATNPSKNDIVKEKKRITFKEHYGVDHFTQTVCERRNRRIKMIKSIEQSCGPFCGMIGKYETECLDELETLINFSIKRNDQIIGYFPDGTIYELGLIIEFDEPVHYIRNHLSKKDQDRQTELENAGFEFYRIKEQEWLLNKELIKSDFRIKIGELLCQKSCV